MIEVVIRWTPLYPPQDEYTEFVVDTIPAMFANNFLQESGSAWASLFSIPKHAPPRKLIEILLRVNGETHIGLTQTWAKVFQEQDVVQIHQIRTPFFLSRTQELEMEATDPDTWEEYKGFKIWWKTVIAT